MNAARATIARMKEIAGAGESPEAAKNGELTWIRDNLVAFWSTAYAGYYDEGRGAVVIDTTAEPLGEDTPFYYVQQSRFAEQEEDVSRQLADLVADYDPRQQFIAVFIRPRAEEREFSIFQIRVAEALADAAREYHLLEVKVASVEKPAKEATVEPPDLETLMAWESEGGCEAACPHSCWVEPDGVCPHGKPSWLLQLGLI